MGNFVKTQPILFFHFSACSLSLSLAHQPPLLSSLSLSFSFLILLLLQLQIRFFVRSRSSSSFRFSVASDHLLSLPSPSLFSPLTVPHPQSFLRRPIIQRYFLLSSSASVISSPSSITNAVNRIFVVGITSTETTTMVIRMSEFIPICHH